MARALPFTHSHTHTQAHLSAGKLVFVESCPLSEAVFGIHLSWTELTKKSCGVYTEPMASQGWDFNSFNTWWEGWMLWKESGPTIQTLVFLPSLPLTSCVTLGSSSNFSGGRKEVGVTRPSEEKGRERERHHWYLGSVSLWHRLLEGKNLSWFKKKKTDLFIWCVLS